jgi:hypothetical protein
MATPIVLPQFDGLIVSVDDAGNGAVSQSTVDAVKSRSKLYTASFDTQVGAWSELLDHTVTPSTYEDTTMSLELNGAGQGVLAWSYGAATGRVLKAALTADSGKTWSAETTVSQAPPSATADVLRTSDRPSVAIDAEGTRYVAWSQSSLNNERHAYSARGMLGQTWEDARPMETRPNGYVFGVKLAMVSPGVPVSAWDQRHTVALRATTSAWSELVLGHDDGTWGAVRVPVGDSSSEQLGANVVANQAGQAFAQWYLQPFQTDRQLWVTRLDAGKWSDPEELSLGVAGTVGASSSAIDPAGNTMTIWAAGAVEATTLWARRFDKESGTYGPAVSVGNPGSDASEPQVAMDAGGNAVVVWLETFGSATSVWASRFDATDGAWSTAELLETSSDTMSKPRIDMTPDGQALIVWMSQSTNKLWYARYH